MNVLLLALALNAHAATIPVADFAKPPTVESMKLSPDGRFLAMVTQQSDYETKLVVLDSSTLKAVGALNSEKRSLVGDFWWVADDRIVVAVARRYGGLDEPYLTGQLLAVNADGKDGKVIHSRFAKRQTGSRVEDRDNDTGFAVMVDPLREDPDHAVIAVYPIGQEAPLTELFRINVHTGARDRIARAPIPRARFLIDTEARPRYAWGVSDEGWQQLYQRSEDRDWTLVNDEQESGQELWPLALAADGETLYLEIREATGPGRTVLWRPGEGEQRVLHEAEVAENMGALRSADFSQIYGVITADGRHEVEIFDRELPEARALGALSKSFAGQLVVPVNWSRGAAQGLFHVSSDRNSGEYYLYDRASGKAGFLLARDEWADPAQMRERMPIRFQARDGLALHGYLTLPAADGERKPPLVVVPHGGPHGVRDDGSFDHWSQMLANRGYAVLQVNFRGSAGYGQDFETQGYRQWGRAMIDDLIDGIRWTLDQGHADSERVCAFGASYGGYASMMLAAREPGMFRCAISYVGLAELGLMYKRGDINDSEYGEQYLERAIGRSDAELNDYSPVTHAARIEAAVMLIHGGEDQRVPVVHAQRMRSALRKAGKDVEWLVKADEGHGFYRQAHREELYQRVLDFLATHLD